MSMADDDALPEGRNPSLEMTREQQTVYNQRRARGDQTHELPSVSSFPVGDIDKHMIPRDPSETLTFPKGGVGQAMYDRHPRVQQLIGFLDEGAGQSTVGRYVYDLAMWAMQRLPDDPELAIGLRRLLDAQVSLMRVEKIRDARGWGKAAHLEP